MRFQCNQCQCILDIDAQPGELVACGNCSSAVTVPPTPTSPGAILGDFAIVREIGVGGMGTVYLARQISLDRDVALKVLLPTFAEDIAFIQSFINEARAAASVNHPNIVQAYAVNSDQGLYYFAMEFVDGSPLQKLLEKNGPLPVDKVIDIASEIISALAYAWQERKIIHRDIKPDNIMITSSGQAKLADLGLARKITEQNPDGSAELYGTPQYIAPELLLGHPATIASDIYSLGATLYHLLSGQYPFTAEQPEEIVNMHIFNKLPALTSVKPDVPAPLAAMIETMLAKRPAHRYANYTELLEDLKRVKKNEMPLHLPAANAQAPLDPDLPDPLAIPEGESADGEATPPAQGATGGRLKIKSSKKKLTLTGGSASGTGVSPSATSLRLSTAGAAPAPSATGVSPSATGAAPAPSATGAAPAPSATDDAPAEADEAPKRRSGRLPVIILIVVILLAAAGGGVWFFLNRSGAGADSDDDAAAPAASDPAIAELAKIKTMIAEKQADDVITAELAHLATELTAGSPAVTDFIATAAPFTEKALDAARAPALQEKQELWDRQVAAAKVAAERKAEEEAAKQEAARQLAEAEKARKAAEQAEKERQEELAAKKEGILSAMPDHACKQDYDAAQRLFVSMTADKDEQASAWAKQWLAIIERAEKIHDTIRNSGNTFAGVDIPMGDRRKWKIADITFDKIKITSMSIAIDKSGKDREDIQTMTLDLRYLLPPQIVQIGRAAAPKAGYEGGETDGSVAAYLLVRGAALQTIRSSLQQLDGADLILADLETITGDAYTSHLITGLPEQDKKQGVLTFNYLRATAPDQIENIPEEVRQALQK